MLLLTMVLLVVVGVALGVVVSMGLRSMVGLGLRTQLPLGPQARSVQRRQGAALRAVVAVLLLFPMLMLLTHLFGALAGR